jgi:pimeloyl-ACP methyl ester carboxylesterase
MYLCGVHVQVTGHARRAVVLVHGVRGSSDSWRSVIPALSSRWQVITLDLPGHGLSIRPSSTPVLSAHAGLVHDVLDVLGVGRVAIVGYSMGASVAADFAARYPECTDRVVLIAPRAVLGPGTIEPAVLHDYFDRYADRGQLFARGGLSRMPSRELPTGRGFERTVPDPVPTLTIAAPHGWRHVPATMVDPLVAFLERPVVSPAIMPPVAGPLSVTRAPSVPPAAPVPMPG